MSPHFHMAQRTIPLNKSYFINNLPVLNNFLLYKWDIVFKNMIQNVLVNNLLPASFHDIQKLVIYFYWI